MVRLLKSAGPAIILVSLVLMPFFGKAFTIDDTLFLRQAQQVSVDPGHPTAFDIVWTEKPAPLRMSEIMVSGPTMAYLLVPTIWAHGAEWVAHATQLLLLITAILGTVALGFRLGTTDREAAIAALVLAATPASLAMASSAMPDIAAMAFGVIGLERLVAWRETRHWAGGLAATLALALGALARSHVLLLLPIGALLLLWTPAAADRAKRIRPAWRLWIPLAMVPLVVAAASYLLRDPEGANSVLDATLRYSGTEQVTANLAAFATHWALVLPLALFWILLHGSRVVRQPLSYLAGIAIGALVWDPEHVLRASLIALAGGLSAGVLADVLMDAWRRRDRVQLALGIALFAALPVGLYQHLPSKYLLVSAPAAALLLARAAARRAPLVAWRTAGITVTAGLVLGVLIIRADAAFADLGRRAAEDLIAARTARGQTVWFAGHWGFQWYAERAGAKVLTLPGHGPMPRPGDFAVSSQNALGAIIDVFQPRSLMTVLASDQPGGRIMSRAAGAGFYSNAWGYLPWTWSDDVLDRYTLWRLDEAVVLK